MDDEKKTKTEETQTIPKGDYEGVLAGRRQFVEDQLSKKILIRKNERTEELNRQGFARHYLCKYTLNDTALQDWIVFVFHYQKHSGKHRHQGGLVIFVLEGKGATEIDGETLEWEPGDMILLPIKPDGVEHKHYNYDESAGCKWIAFINIPLWDHVASEMAQLELSPEFLARYGNIAGGITAPTRHSRREVQPHKIGKPELTKKAASTAEQEPKTLFDELIKRRDEERKQRENAIWLIKGKSLQWESNAHGFMRWYLHPSMQNLAIRTLMSYLQEIPPGGKSGRQRHPGNVIMYILEGKGYTILDDERYEWEAGDVMTLPLRQGGVVYQHFNSDASQPVRLIAVEPNLIDATGIDRGSGFEELEPAPPIRL
jgi:quercetin dioxygenase-like cupin family protein